ncbi:MAG: alcohol dehydrogenase catalytic domain-containing protein [Bacillota bacterium]|nr:alcohol dehydrogenase catalytic domain-containing protein [Bacillota bacterium]
MTIPEKMTALVLKQYNDYSIEKVDVPEPGYQEALCRVKSVAICGTDPGLIAGKFAGIWPREFPFIPGHEWAGEIVALGENTQEFGWKIGERVAGTSHVGCGICRMCTTGRYNLCDYYGNKKVHRHYGHYSQGAYAEYQAAHIKTLHRLPESLSFDQGAMVDGTSIALHSAKRGKICPGDTVVIFGPGPMGLQVYMCAEALGAGRIIVIGRGDRLLKAKELGAEIVDIEKGDPVKEVLELTNGRGAEVIVECSGAHDVAAQAIQVARKNANIVFAGLPKQNVEIPMLKLILEEMNLFGVRANQSTCEEIIPLMVKGKVQPEKIITHHFPLTEFPKALETFVKRLDRALKVVLHPDLN